MILRERRISGIRWVESADAAYDRAVHIRATQINEAMKLAAVKALAELAQTPVPDIVNLAYNAKTISFGPDYIIPKPLDPRLLATVAPSVAKAAMDSGVARIKIDNWEEYQLTLNRRLGLDNQLLRVIGFHMQIFALFFY